MDDYYEVFGVAPGATREEIRAAYRARRDELAGRDTDKARSEIARLNRAWNVLSDPFQRARHDEKLARPPGDDADTEEPDEGTVTAKGTRSRRGRAAPPPTPVVAASGLTLAPPRSRLFAMVVDVAVLFLALFILLPVAFAPLAEEVKVRVKADKKAESTSAPSVSVTSVMTSTTVRPSGQKDSGTSGSDNKTSAAKYQVERRFSPAESTAGVVLSVLIPLLYLVPLSVRTGQSLGKRLLGLRLVRTDGSPAGWRESLVHYGIPIGVWFLVGPVPIVGPVLAFGVVLWHLRDRNGQGLHDRLAGTQVVVADPARTRG